MAEQFALEQILGNRGAVDRQKRAPAAVAVLVNRPRHQFLPGPALPQNQHRHILGRHPANLLVDRLHGRAPPDQPVPATVGGPLVLGKHGGDLHPPAGLARLADQVAQCAEIQRLEQIFVGPPLRRLDGQIRGPVPRHQNDWCAGIQLLQGIEGLQAGAVAKVYVEHHHIRLNLSHLLHRLRPIRGETQSQIGRFQHPTIGMQD